MKTIYEKWNEYITNKQIVLYIKNLRYVEKALIKCIWKKEIENIDTLTSSLINTINEIRKHYELNKEE